MTDNRYPEGLVLTQEDFSACGWQEVLDDMSSKSYITMCQAFHAAEKQAHEQGRQVRGKALWLLARACSMTLSPDSPNDPFKPMAELHSGHRSPIPEDFHQPDLDFFAQAVHAIENPWLKARLADLVWLRCRDFKFALVAIDSYRAIPLTVEAWMDGGRECWKRAVALALMLGGGAGNRQSEMRTVIVGAFQSARMDNGLFGLELADLLECYQLENDQQASIATRLKLLACEFEREGNLLSARQYFQHAIRWFRKSGNKAKSVDMTVALSECWVQEATTHVSTEPPSHLVAGMFYDKAIQTYRTIPKSERTSQVDDRIAELRALLRESGTGSLDEMRVVQTSEVDISQIVDEARRSVAGKENKTEALKAFANLRGGIDADQLREHAIKRHADFPLLSLFPTIMMSRDGRFVDRQHGGDHEQAVQSQMIAEYLIIVRCAAEARILPALETLLLEHRFREADFINIAWDSPIVPIGRERLFGKALFAGCERDFATALHLLVPQIEHLVRLCLKHAQVQTVHLDQNGIENEIGLSSLMDIPETEKIIGKDLSYEIKALLCSHSGPNFRNSLAHGLLDDDEYQSFGAVYVWWLGLGLVFNAFWHVSHEDSEVDEQDEK